MVTNKVSMDVKVGGPGNNKARETDGGFSVQRFVQKAVVKVGAILTDVALEQRVYETHLVLEAALHEMSAEYRCDRSKVTTLHGIIPLRSLSIIVQFAFNSRSMTLPVGSGIIGIVRDWEANSIIPRCPRHYQSSGRKIPKQDLSFFVERVKL